jgi:hypothetical protein
MGADDRREGCVPKRWLAIAGVAAWTLLSAASALPQTPSADALAAAREMFEVAKIGDQYKMMMPMIVQGMKPAIVQGRPQVERDFDAIAPVLMAGFESRLAEITEAVARIYAENFTAAELRELTAFYRGPTGQKFLQRLPAILQSSMAVGQQIGQRLGQELQGRMIEELRKKGHNI